MRCAASATCHVAFGEATAILAGDALQALAFEILAGDPLQAGAPDIHVDMLHTLAAACGSQGMAGGQALDLAAVGQTLHPADLERMHVYKTGALIRASVRLGALAAGCRDGALLATLEKYGHCVGLAFQIRDDILDVEGDSATLGKFRRQGRRGREADLPGDTRHGRCARAARGADAGRYRRTAADCHAGR